MGVVYNPDRNTLIPISTVSGEITYLTAGLIYEKMQSCLIIGTEVTYLKHYPDQDLYIADNSYMQIGYTCIFSNRAQRDPFSYFHRWNPNTQEFVIRGGVSLNLSNATKNGIMYFYFPSNNAYTILSYDYNRLFFNNVEEVKATIRVNYYLPDYDYTYAKITYKQDSEPASETDGTSVNILKDQSSVNIEGLEEEKTYYFKIFTDKSESEAFPYTIPVDPVPPEYREYIKCINGSENYQNRHCYITYIKEWQFYPDSYDPQRTYYHGSILGKTIYSNPTNSGFTNVQSSSDKTAVAVGNSIISVRITSDNDVYRISTDNMTLDNSIFEYIYNSPRTCAFGVLTINTQQLSLSVYNGLNYNTASWLESGLAQTFNSLTSAFDFINASFRNVDIYVDGVLWSKATN